MFHKIAIVTAILYFIRDRYLSAKTMIILIFFAYLVGILFPFNDYIIPIMLSTEFVVFTDYIGTAYADELGSFYVVMIYQVLLIGIYMIIKGKSENVCERIIFNIYICSTIWLILFSKLGIFAGRVATIFTTVEIFIIPYIIESISNKTGRYMCLIMVVLIYLFILILKCKNIIYNNMLFDIL